MTKPCNCGSDQPRFEAAFDFSTLPRPVGYRPTYAGTIDAHRRGLLSLGFLWELAGRDEVFAAHLRRHGVERP